MIVFGKASQKILLDTELKIDEISMDALTWLTKYKIPIASSCIGEGICKKCIINENYLACKTKLLDLGIKTEHALIKINIIVAYL